MRNDAQLNLTPSRGPSVWETGRLQARDPAGRERLALALGGVALALGGLRCGGRMGRLLGGLGAALALRAGLGCNDLHALRCVVNRFRSGTPDAVEHASVESFPASDSPSWTPTAGSRPATAAGGPPHAQGA